MICFWYGFWGVAAFYASVMAIGLAVAWFVGRNSEQGGQGTD